MSTILEKRDDYFDICRTFLVISMIIAHTFQWYCIYPYNRHLSFFVLVDFVFLSGFTIAAVNVHKMINQSYSTNIAIFKRAAKIIALFFICNIFIVSFYNGWGLLLPKYNDILEFFVAIFTRADNEMYGFVILLPIGLTMFLSIIVLMFFRKTTHLLFLLIILLTIHILSKWTGWLTSYGPSMLLIGCIGSTIGALSTHLNWDMFIQEITKENT